jgi:hypothetical protein
VLDAALTLFAERGLDATSMDAIAEASGATRRPTPTPDPTFSQCDFEPDLLAPADGRCDESPDFGVAIPAGGPDRVIRGATGESVTTNGGTALRCGRVRRAPGGGPE